MGGALCPKFVKPRKPGAPHRVPSPAATHPVGAWSAMPGWMPGIGRRSMKSCMFPWTRPLRSGFLFGRCGCLAIGNV